MKLELLPITELSDAIGDSGRYYQTPVGSLPSVTTVIGRFENRDGNKMQEWIDRVGVEEAERVKKKAAVRGTNLHNIIESYIRQDPDYRKGHHAGTTVLFKDVKPILDKIDIVKGIELPLYSKKLKTAGKTDLLVGFRLGDRVVNAIVDYKTSGYQKDESDITGYFWQTTTYAMMVEELYSIEVPYVIIIMTCEYDPPKVFIKRNEAFRPAVEEIFRQYAY